jgi:phenylpyruvate tautomerase PptA (4-oxalocrotonate tautomerase family)
MTIVTIEIWERYTLDQKRQLAKDITDAFAKIGTVPATVNIIFKENPRSCWAQGGQLCSDFRIPEGA